MRAHPKSFLPNSPNYYWSQALDYDAMGNETMANCYLFLYYISTIGE